MSTDYTASVIKWDPFYLNFQLDQDFNDGIFNLLMNII